MGVLGDIAFEWKDIQTVGMVASTRQVVDLPAETISVRYYISSAKLTAKELMESSRAHWSIDVQLHCRLDVAMREDECRIRRGEAGENFAVIRHMALNLLNADKSFKASIKRKQNGQAGIMLIYPQSLQGKGFRNLALRLKG